jgi:hypothetical protein
MKHIKTWSERCEEHPDHQEKIISERMIQERMQEEIDELRQALETEQEPVAWISDSPTKGNGKQLHWTKSEAWRWSSNITPLYTAPQKREWVGLTEEEIDALSQARSLTDELMDCVDRLGSEADTVDPRVWQHLLVYAPKPEEEPVAWLDAEMSQAYTIDELPDASGTGFLPLYTAPPKREWVGLTDDDVIYFRYQATFCDEFDAAFMAELIEKDLKEKNNG